jgi:orotidine-5'-phosphate decarboxylase
MVRIIAALDLPDVNRAVTLGAVLRDHVDGFKVGLGLLYAPGVDAIGEVAALGLPVFADAKLNDIPSQVERAARALGQRGVRWLTAHATGGADMLRAAVAGLASVDGDAGVLAVTVLTSLDEERLAEIGIDATPNQLASTLAAVAATTGCEGVICSPYELDTVRDAAPHLLRMVPGIRVAAAEDDQARTATPAAAVASGADYLVVGRPISASPDPVAAAIAIKEAGAVPVS